MAIFRYSSSGTPGTLPSVITGAGDAFALDSALADTLIVDAGAFLISTDPAPGLAGAYLAPTGGWTATVNGTIQGGGFGILLEVGNAALSTINIGTEGSVSGNTIYGITAGSSATINNAGTIFGGDVGIILGNGAHTITNSGTITGGGFAGIFDTAGSGAVTVTNTGGVFGNVNLDVGTNTLKNSGTISGNYIGLGGADSVTNSGSLSGFVQLGDGTNALTNTGSITGVDGNGISVLGGLGADTVSNTKTIAGAVTIGGNGSDTSTNKLTNSGTIGANNSGFSYGGGNGIDTITNSGKLNGALFLGDGANTLINSGTIGGSGNVDGGTGVDKITNSGTISGGVGLGGSADTITNAVRVGNVGVGGTITGGVNTGDGADMFNNFVTFQVLVGTVLTTVTASGKVGGIIDLGNGDDRFNGGAFAETVKDGNGSDVINLGGGNDIYIATGGAPVLDGVNDIINGGLGTDTYDASAATGFVKVNFSLLARGGVAAGTAIGPNVDGAVVGHRDTLSNFENALGGGDADEFYGSETANRFDGGAGDDQLFGFGGNDLLIGGFGIDTLVGGAGADRMTGGVDGDTFRYNAVADSGVTAATRDTITDFTGGATGDIIDLSLIDAKTTVVGNDTFSFIGTNVNWGGVAGQLRAYWTASGQIIEGDVNGDKAADFSIALIDASHAIPLNSSDFLL